MSLRSVGVGLVVCSWMAAPLTAQEAGDAGKTVEALGQRVLGATKALERAIAAEQRARAEVAKALAALGKAAIPALLKVVEAKGGSADARFVAECRATLERLGWVSPDTKRAMQKLLDDLKDGEFEDEDVFAVVEIGGYAVTQVIAALDGAGFKGKTKERAMLIRLLGELGAAGRYEVFADLLKKRLAGGTVEERSAACEALATAAEVPEDQITGDPDKARMQARDAAIASSGGVGPLLATLAHAGDAEVRAGAADALAAHGRKDAVGALVTAIGDANADVRSAAEEALIDITDHEADSGAAWKRWWEGQKAGYAPQTATPARAPGK